MKKIVIYGLIVASGFGSLPASMKQTELELFELERKNNLKKNKQDIFKAIDYPMGTLQFIKRDHNTSYHWLIYQKQLRLTNCIQEKSKVYKKTHISILQTFCINAYRRCPIKWDNTPLMQLNNDYEKFIKLENRLHDLEEAINSYDFDEHLMKAINSLAWDYDHKTLKILNHEKYFLSVLPPISDFFMNIFNKKTLR